MMDKGNGILRYLGPGESPTFAGMAKRKFYVIWVGSEPGIYDSWHDAKARIQGYPGAKYKSYPTLEEARDGPMKLLRPSRFLVEVDASPPVFERWEIEEAPEDD